MGIPASYSVELPQRIAWLIESLWHVVDEDSASARRFGGPLTTTFLLSMMTPLILLPIERIQKHLKRGKEGEGNADERHLAGPIVEEINRVFFSDRAGSPPTTLSNAPFFRRTQGWRYCLAKTFNLSRGLSDSLVSDLRDPAAADAALDLPALTFVEALRNALAHGGVAYLDREGRSSYNKKADMLAFVSEKRDKKIVLGLHVLRISEAGLREFARDWVRWIVEAGISQDLAA